VLLIAKQDDGSLALRAPPGPWEIRDETSRTSSPACTREGLLYELREWKCSESPISHLSRHFIHIVAKDRLFGSVRQMARSLREAALQLRMRARGPDGALLLFIT
jgi:hypothetical protein